LCDDYCYAVVRHDGGWEIADAYVARPIHVKYVATGLQLSNESSFPASDQRLTAPLGPGESCVFSENNNTPHAHMLRFESWDSLEQTPITIGSGISASCAWGWDDELCYCQVIVDKPTHFQPYTNKGLWEGDCVRLAILPGVANTPCPSSEAINRKRTPGTTPLDGALTPEGVKLSIRWIHYNGEHDGSSLAVSRSETQTIYRFAIRWEVLKLTPPQLGDIMFCNGQLHMHDGESYQGYAPFSKGNDLTSPPEKWIWAVVEE